MTQTSKTGSLFAIPITDDEFVTARVILDLETCGANRGLAPWFSGLHSQSEGLLIEVYEDVHPKPSSTPSGLLIRHVVTWADPLEEGKWPQVGTGNSSCDDIDFSATHMMLGNQTVICRGDVALPLNVESDWLRELAPEARPGIVGANVVVNAALYELGRISELPEGRLRRGDNASLRRDDLRNYDEFDHILDQVDIDRELRWDEPYYDFALYHGWDTRRFFVDLTDSGDIILCPYCQTATLVIG